MLRFAVLTGWREFFAKSFSLLSRAEGIWQKTKNRADDNQLGG